MPLPVRYRLLLPLLALPACGRLTTLATGVSPAENHLRVRHEVLVPMDDGVELATDVYLPRTDGPFPTVLVRTPYSKRNGVQFTPALARTFARHGYAVVVQDVRGRFASEGEWDPFAHEQADGLATLAWLRAQPWSNGDVGTFGLSYYGFTQWALAAAKPEGLKTMVPVIISSDLHGWFYRGGAFRPELATTWALSVADAHGDRGPARSDVEKAWAHWPAVEADDAVLRDLPWYDTWVSSPDPGPPYTDWLPADLPADIDLPVLLVGGWFDIFVADQVRDFQHLRHGALLVGPWAHTLGLLGTGDLEPGPDGAFPPVIGTILAWMDHHLAGTGPAPTWGPVRTWEVGTLSLIHI